MGERQIPLYRTIIDPDGAVIHAVCSSPLGVVQRAVSGLWVESAPDGQPTGRHAGTRRRLVGAMVAEHLPDCRPTA